MASSKDSIHDDINRFDDIFHSLGDDMDQMDDELLDFNTLPLDFFDQDPQPDIPFVQDKTKRTTTESMKRSLSLQLTTTTTTTTKKIRNETVTKIIPNYLAPRNQIFEQQMSPLMESSDDFITLEDLSEYACLLHYAGVCQMDITLWNAYLQSGVGDLKELEIPPSNLTTSRTNPLHFWPEKVKEVFKEENQPSAMIDNDKNFDQYVQFVYGKLQTFREQLKEYQDQIEEKKQRFNSSIHETIENYVEQNGLRLLRIPNDVLVSTVKYDFINRLITDAFQQEKPNEKQYQIYQELYQAKWKQLNSKFNVLILKQRLIHQHLPKQFQSIQVPIPTDLETIIHENTRQRLKDRCDKILQQVKSEMMLVYIETAEIEMKQTERHFDSLMQQMRDRQQNGPIREKLTSKMLDLMEHRFLLFNRQLTQVYESKIRFFVKAPTVKN